MRFSLREQQQEMGLIKFWKGFSRLSFVLIRQLGAGGGLHRRAVKGPLVDSAEQRIICQNFTIELNHRRDMLYLHFSNSVTQLLGREVKSTDDAEPAYAFST